MHRLGHPSLRSMGFAGQPGLGGLDVGIYHRIMATRPQNLIKFHPLWESSGALALDYSWRKNNGTHVGVTLGEPGPGDGRFSPFYDGLLDYTTVISAGFTADFNGAEGTIMIPGKVANAGVWTDGIARNLVNLYVDGSNYVNLRRNAVNNELRWFHRAGGTNCLLDMGGFSYVDWFYMTLTWSKSGNVVKAFMNGLQVGANMTPVGVWAGPLGLAVIGANNLVPAGPWFGWLGPCPIWNVALVPTEVAFVARRV